MLCSATDVADVVEEFELERAALELAGTIVDATRIVGVT